MNTLHMLAFGFHGGRGASGIFALLVIILLAVFFAGAIGKGGDK